MHFKKSLIASAALLLASGAQADDHACTIESGRVSIVGNEFPAIHAVADRAATCSGGVEVSANLTADHQTINLPGMQANPAEYTTAVVANSSLVTLMNEDVVRPLDDLVEQYGEGLSKNQLITVDGKIMAIAFMANAQHQVYRADVLEEAGVETPTTYEGMLEAAEKIRAAGIMEYPLAGTFKAGWNLGQEFTNMYLGFGGEFFEPGSAAVSINNEQGVATLEMLKSLSEYMNPDFLTHDSNAVQAEWQAGNAAIMNMWGSRMESLLDAEGAQPGVAENTVAGGAMTVGGGEQPATTLWWDGFTIAKNISDEDAAATFQAMMHAINPEILTDETSPLAVWLLDGYEPTEAAAGVFASAAANATPYPMLPYQGLLHTALGAELPDFMQGKEDAATALADIEAAYTAAAKEKGFLN